MLEASLILFLPFLLNNKLGFELRIKYFLVQALGSFLLLYMFVFGFKRVGLLIIIIMFKIGMAPFYSWVSFIMNKIDWNRIFFFLSLLKLIPLMALRKLYLHRSSILTFILLNCLVRGAGGLGCLCLRKLMMYSSFGHMRWIFSSIYCSEFLWREYYLVYISTFILILYIFLKDVKYYVIDITKLRIVNFFSVIIMLRLSGLPPFSLFVLKCYVLFEAILSISYFFLLILIITSLVTLYYYLYLMVNLYIMPGEKNSLQKNKKIWAILLVFRLVNLLIAYILIYLTP